MKQQLTRAVDAAERTVTGLHERLFLSTDGRWLGRVGRMPVIMLTTTGRKTGKRRTTMLTAPIADGDELVLVASRGGAPHHPAWFLNLRDNPDVEVTIRGRTEPMTARIASAEEKRQMWGRIVRASPTYALYQIRARRDIPVVVLRPKD
jgi:deazaflavin-dependent oxidoreductase (nitroreductase family)